MSHLRLQFTTLTANMRVHECALNVLNAKQFSLNFLFAFFSPDDDDTRTNISLLSFGVNELWINNQKGVS